MKNESVANFNFQTRQGNVERLNQEVFDLIIIGGGIVGAGIARDATSRGMKVALVEKGDFAQGTSSRSSKLIHGGIRYLENLEFGLVFEALNEREKLYDIAPTLVHPLRFVLPVYKDSRVSYFKMGLGMWLYDLLSLLQAELHEALNPEETISKVPQLKAEGLSGSYVYSDAYMDDDRLTIETMHSAHHKGAVIANFVEATGVTWSDDKKQISGVDCIDRKSGRRIIIRGNHVVSCVGPWTDQFGSKALNDWKNILRPTKGIHLTLRKERFPISDAVVMPADKESRIVFAIPRHEMVIIGTTDTDFNGSPDEVNVTKEDVDYLLSIANEYFPKLFLTKKDIVATYSGVRPLVKDDSESESKTSREHTFISDPRGITFVAGGKYTTYRLIAEQAVELCLKGLPVEDRIQFNKNSTETALYDAISSENVARARNLIPIWAKHSYLSTEDITWLVDRHGLFAESLIRTGASQHWSTWEIELYYSIHNTMCLSLLDFYTRRVPLFLAERDHGVKHLDILGLLMQNELGWSDTERESQKQNVRDYIKTQLSWRN